MAGSSIWAPIGDPGPPGPQGPVGPPGPPGPAGPGLAEFVASLANQTAPNEGARLVGFRMRTLYAKMYQDGVSPLDFGAVGNYVADDAVPIQLAANEAIATGRKFLIDDTFATSVPIVLSNFSGLHVVCSGALRWIGGAADAIITFKNYATLKIEGVLSLEGLYNLNLKYGIKFFGEFASASGASLTSVSGVNFVGCRQTYCWGDVTAPDKLVSENFVYGGHWYGCPGGVSIIGTQTVVGHHGVNAITGYNGGAGTWLTLPRFCYAIQGGNLTVVDDEALIVDATNGVICKLNPISGSAIGNQYGSIKFKSCWIESASPIVQATNPLAVGTLVKGSSLIQMEGCSGYMSQNLATEIFCDSDWQGPIDIGVNLFHRPVQRTQANIAVNSSNCLINVQDLSFGELSRQGIGGVVGGLVKFGYRDIVQLSNTSNQALTANVQDVIRWQSSDASTPYARHSSGYSTVTGVLTLGKEGLKNARITGIVRLASIVNTTNVSFSVFVNGGAVAFSTSRPQDGATGIQQFDFILGDLPANATLWMGITSSVSTTINFGVFEKCVISGKF